MMKKNYLEEKNQKLIYTCFDYYPGTFATGDNESQENFAYFTNGCLYIIMFKFFKSYNCRHFPLLVLL